MGKDLYQPEGNYYDKYHSSNLIVKWMMKRYFEDLQSLLPQKKERLGILEAGCGEGRIIDFVASCYKYDCRAEGFDISDKVISKATKEYPKIHFTTGNIYEMSETGYDLVLCCEVLEHLENPGGVLRELRNATQEYLIVSVPREPIWRILNMLRGKYWRNFGNTPGHIQHWSYREFLHLLQDSGMEIAQVKKPFPWTMVLLKWNKNCHENEGREKDSLYVVMPAYNEEANIEEVVREWYPILEGKHEKSRLVVADSGSSDCTHTILKELKETFPKLEILDGTDRQHGPKLIALYNYAIKQEIDYVFQTDSDGQTEPVEFEEFWDLRNAYDAVIGNRRVRGDGKLRALVERVVCFLLKIYFNISVPDANAPFRLMKTDLIKKYLDRLPENYNLPNIMMTTYFKYYKECITFKTITFKSRRRGRNLINWREIIHIGWQALYDFAELKRNMN